MTKRNSLKEAPYGKRQAYVGDGHLVDLGMELREFAYGGNDIWLPNDPFEATLVLVNYERGRSAARFIWEDPDTSTRYPMFMSGMVDLVKGHRIEKGVATATWIVVKRGQNYGLEAYSA